MPFFGLMTVVAVLSVAWNGSDVKVVPRSSHPTLSPIWLISSLNNPAVGVIEDQDVLCIHSSHK